MRIFILFVIVCFGSMHAKAQREELEIIQELFRLRNEHKADSVEKLYSDTVLIYMKFLKNIPRKKITQVDKLFWKMHPANKFEITGPVQIKTIKGIVTAVIFGKEYLDGISFKKERIEITFDRNKKINSFRGFSVK